MKKILLAVLLVMLMAAAPAGASTVVTEQTGTGLTSYNTSTSGSSSEPWTIAESLSGPLTLKFNEPSVVALLSALGPGNTTESGHAYGKWFEKTVTNNSNATWTSFELELQVVPGTPSLDGDGLSFAQGGELTFFSDVFSEYSAIEDIRDYLNFHGGSVAPGESVTFTFAITDNQTRNTFYLLETPNKREVGVPEPASLLLLGFGVAGLAGIRRKMK